MLKVLASLLALVLVAASAQAQPGLVTDAPIRVASGSLVKVGDSEGQVLVKFGRAPDRETVLEDRRGGAVGQRWVYIEPGYSGRIVTIELHGGQVARLWSERIE